MRVRRAVARATATTACLIALSAALAGCSEEPTPKFDDPPVAAPEPEQETPEAFIKRWAELERDMQNTGETEAYRAVVSDECIPCTYLIDRVKEIYAAGGYIKTDGMLVEEVTRSSKNVYIAAVTTAPTEYRSSETGPTESLPGEKTFWVLGLRNVRGDITVRSLSEQNRQQ